MLGLKKQSPVSSIVQGTKKSLFIPQLSCKKINLLDLLILLLIISNNLSL